MAEPLSEPLSFEKYSQIVLEAANRGALIAIETHRRMGRSIVVMEDGQIKHIKAKDITPRALPHDEWEKD